MEFKFDTEKPKSAQPKTRIYFPSDDGTLRPIDDDAPLPFRPRRTKKGEVAVSQSVVQFSSQSKLLILLSVFLIALTALVSLFGSAEYAKLVTQIGSVETEIETYEQQLSQVRKTQSSLNDYSSINDACLNRNMQLIWEPDVFGSEGTTP